MPDVRFSAAGPNKTACYISILPIVCLTVLPLLSCQAARTASPPPPLAQTAVPEPEAGPSPPPDEGLEAPAGGALVLDRPPRDQNAMEPMPLSPPSAYSAGILGPAAAAPVRPLPPLLPIPVDGTLKVGVAEAVLMGLNNNKSFQVELLSPHVEETYWEDERAIFDPVLLADGAATRDRSGAFKYNRGWGWSAGASQFLPTGTTVDMSIGSTMDEDDPSTKTEFDKYNTFLDFTVTQSLLRGVGPAVNLATLRQARNNVLSSEQALRGFAESLAATIENTYWDYVLAHEEIQVYEKSLKLSRRLIRDTEERIRLGQVARTDIYFVEAEAATREQDLIDARSRREDLRFQLLKLINPPGTDFWMWDVHTVTPMDIVPFKISHVAEHVRVARVYRPALNEARLAVRNGRLETVKTSNGLLPVLDVYFTVGLSGYSNLYERAWKDLFSGNWEPDAIVGVRAQFPPINRQARADHSRSLMELRQQEEALVNLEQEVEKEVLNACVEIDRSVEQIEATEVTVRYQQKKLETELDRYSMGISTMYPVAQAERDLVLSQIDEVRSRIDFLKALVQLYLSEGSLLARRGIGFPGDQPLAPAPYDKWDRKVQKTENR